MCTHQGWTYVGGEFTRAGDKATYNFARYRSDGGSNIDSNVWEILPSVGLGHVSKIDDIVKLQAEDPRKIASFVNAIVCPETKSYLTLAGHFSFVSRKLDSGTSMHQSNFEANYMNVSNIVMFNVDTLSFSRIIRKINTTHESTGVTVSGNANETNNVAVIYALTCVNESSCDRMFAGGNFQKAFDVNVNHIFGFDVMYPPTKATNSSHATVSKIDYVGKNVRGVNGIVNAISVLSERNIIFGGAFTSVSTTFAASIALWDGISGSAGTTSCVPTSGYEIAQLAGDECTVPAVCCHGIGGIVYSIERISSDSVMIGGSFATSFSHPNAQNLVQVVVNSTLPAEVRKIIFPGWQGANDTAFRTSQGSVHAIQCVERDEGDRCTEMWIGGSFREVEKSYASVLVDSVRTPLGVVVLKESTASSASPLPSFPTPILYDIFGVPELDAPYNFSASKKGDVVQTIAVSRRDGDTLSVVLGGIVNDTHNVFHLHREWTEASDLKLKETSALMPPNGNASNDHTPFGLYGLCPAGSFCPSGGVQVACPIDWGIYCPEGSTTLDEDNICPAGYYCRTPSVIQACPSRHFCREGSIEPQACFVFEVCPAGSAKADGSIYGVFIVIVLMLSLYVFRSVYLQMRNRRRRKRSKNDIMRLLGLDVLVPRWRRDTIIKSPNSEISWEASQRSLLSNASSSPRHVSEIDNTSIILPRVESIQDANSEVSDVEVSDVDFLSGDDIVDDEDNASESKSDLPGPSLKRIESYSELLEEKTHVAAVRFQNLTVSLDRSSALVDGASCIADTVLFNLLRCCGKTTSAERADENPRKGKGSPKLSRPLLKESGRKSPRSPSRGQARRRRRRYRRRRHVILNSVSGNFRPYHVTAIMGPSGCGKTTLLSAVGNRLRSPAKLSSGRVLLNGKTCTSSTGGLPLDVIGFVPQDDIMLTELTVRQILWFSLLLKGRPDRSFDENERFINNLLVALDLFKVRHTIVGDASSRGISGGQRKRVNIGIELVAEPSVVLLDEPTSGLDSTASADLVSNLRSFAKKGLTIAAVIHQPRAEILNMIDDLIILREGGFLVYHGPSREALDFFEGAGCVRPPMTSIADFILDVTTQDRTLPEKWRRHRTSCIRRTREQRSKVSNANHDVAAGKYAIDDDDDGGGDGNILSVVTIDQNSNEEEEELFTDEEDWWPDKETVKMRPIPKRPRPWSIVQFIVFFRRGLIQHAWRRPWVLIMDGATLVVAGGLLGAVFSSNDQQDLTMRYLLASLALGLTGMQMAQRVFGSERIQFWRESSAGISVSAYFFGKVLSFFPVMAMAPCLFLILFYNMTSPRYGFGSYLVTCLFCNFTVTQLGYLVSILFQPRSALIVSVVLNVIALLFAGVNPNVQTMADTPYGTYGMDVSYARWTVEMQFLKELSHYPRAAYRLHVVQDFLDRLGYGDSDDSHDFYEAQYRKCAAHLLYIGLGAMALSFLLLHRQARNNVI
eukprot:g735.t1